MSTSGKREKLYLVSLGLLSLLMLWKPVTAFAECGGVHAPDSHTDRNWIKSDKAIYVAKDGKIFETKFDSNKWVQLAEHDFRYISDFQISPDMRYIFYSGFSKERGFSNYLFDTKLKRDIELNISSSNVDNVHFSPDSLKLAWVTDQARLIPHKVVIRYLESSKEEKFDYPVDAQAIHEYRMTELKWSMDSGSVFLGTIAYPEGAYFKLDLRTREFQHIEGRYHPFRDYKDIEDYGFHFFENGDEQQFYKPMCLQSQCSGQGKPQSGVSAVIDDEYNLIINNNGQNKTIDKGSYTQCEGVTIRILSWLENGSYLVYQKNGATYVYGMTEDKTAELFDAPGIEFSWEDFDNRQQPSFP